MALVKVSIIIPTYNRGKYIIQAIESVFNQTVSDFEVIVVDDGSTDDTAEILISYLNKVRYIKTENRGVAHARNVGMRMSVGEYISFLDSDDLYYPFKTELQARLLDAYPNISMVSSEFSSFDDNGFYDEYHLQKYHYSGFQGGGLTYDNIYPDKTKIAEIGIYSGQLHRDAYVYFGNIFDTYFQYMVVCTNTIMFRRSILEKIGFQNEQFQLLQEHNFVLRITKYYKVAFIDIPTYKLRYHGSQASDISRASSNKNSLDLVIKKQRYLLDTTIELGVNDSDYYSRHRNLVNKRMVELLKALAIPLMCKSEGADEARELFYRCLKFDYSARLLGLATYLPCIGRKAVVKMSKIMNLL